MLCAVLDEPPPPPYDHVELRQDAHVVAIPKRVTHLIGQALDRPWVVHRRNITLWLKHDRDMVLGEHRVTLKQRPQICLIRIVAHDKLPLLLLRAERVEEALDDRMAQVALAGASQLWGEAPQV